MFLPLGLYRHVFVLKLSLCCCNSHSKFVVKQKTTQTPNNETVECTMNHFKS